MNIHEYQAKQLYRQYGVPTAMGFPAVSVDEAVEAAKKLPGPVWVVKSQIHAGGRGGAVVGLLPVSVGHRRERRPTGDKTFRHPLTSEFPDGAPSRRRNAHRKPTGHRRSPGLCTGRNQIAS